MKRKSANIMIVLILAISITLPVNMITGVNAEGEAAIWTDKADYAPGETVTIYGTNFLPNTTIIVNVTRPDGHVDSSLDHGTDVVYKVTVTYLEDGTTDENGDFTAAYVLDGIEGTYNVTATDGTNTAETTFTDQTINTYEDDAHTTVRTVFKRGDTVYALATDLSTGSTYRIRWDNPSSLVRTSDSASGVTELADSYVLPMDAAGSWEVQIQHQISVFLWTTDAYSYFTVDTTPPTGSITINDGALYTTSTLVTLSLTYSDANGVDKVRYSNDGTWDTEPWETPSGTKAWTLTSGEGTKTVYYQIKDNAGLESSTYSGTIILYTAGAATHFHVEGFPDPVNAGTLGSVTVTAKDALDNTVAGYVGTVNFTSTDSQAVLPANHTFVAGDNGIHTFSATLKTAGEQSITATDTVSSEITGSQTDITVNPAAPDHFVFDTINSPQVAGTGYSITITAKDEFKNTVTSYTGNPDLTSSSWVGTKNLGAFSGGTKTGSVTSTIAGSTKITATDGLVTGDSNAFTVNPAAGSIFTASITPTTSNTGDTTSYTITITNLCSSTDSLGYVTIDIPSGFAVDTISTPVASGGQTWTVTTLGSQIVLQASSTSDRLSHNEQVSVTFTATPSTSGVKEWTTRAYAYSGSAEFLLVTGVDTTVTHPPTSNSGTGWNNPDHAYDDGGDYADSDYDGDQQTYGGYGFGLTPDAVVSQVRVGLDAWAYGVLGFGMDNIRLEVYDGSWHICSPNPIPLSMSEDTYWCDVTALSSGGWTGSEVNSIQTRVTHVLGGFESSPVYLDWIRVEVTYTTLGPQPTVTVTAPSNVPPVANANGPYTGNEGTAVSFDASASSDSDGTIVLYEWDWNNDGIYDESSSSSSASHTWNDNGGYTVKLQVTDDDGATDDSTASVTISDSGPTAAFDWSPKPQDEGSSVSFTDQSTSSPDTIVSWSWTFGDGGTSTSQSPSHIYADNGVYTVRLTVTDDDGSANHVEHDVTINNAAPTLDPIGDQSIPWGEELIFTATADDPGIYDTLTFSLEGTVPLGAGIDGTSGGFSWTPTSAQVGDHTFKVRVTDDGSPGLYAEEEITVTVGERATTLVYSGDSSAQYSDPATVTATLTDTLTGDPIVGKTINFTIESQWETAITNEAGVATTTITLTQPEGTYTVTSVFEEDSSYLGSSDSDAFKIDKEDVTIDYSGDTDAMTALGATSAPIELKAHLDQTDSNLGNLGLARVEFELVNEGGGGRIFAHNVPVDPLTGDAITTKTVPLGTYLIKVRVETTNEYWTGTLVDDLLNVISGTGSKMVTGGGWIQDLLSINGKGNFGFTVNYQKNGAPKGHFVYLWRGSDGYNYLVKSNSWSDGGLTFKDAKSAYFIGRCTIQRIERTTGIETTLGNYRFRVDIFDGDLMSPRVADTFALKIWNPADSSIYRQIGTSTLGGGNIIIHSK